LPDAQDLIQEIHELAPLVLMDPMLLAAARGIKTLAVRVQRQNDKRVARRQFLARHARFGASTTPRRRHPQRALAMNNARRRCLSSK